MLNIDSIQKGLVIDHIAAGKGMKIFKYLKLDEADFTVALIKNVCSKKMGRKDIIKIENEIDIDLDVLGFIDHNITINVIEGDKIVDKLNLELPEQVSHVVKCNNPRCITSIEQEIAHTFRLVDKEKKVYRCIYCDQAYDPNKQDI
ncbi:aspartate carbamoyltransferase regulatory subunit [Dethiosulfatibacter aminovorans DSM 17477]|uniref:Aspartate carbamoyltransferase regulatory subunit n=1 Tax=Dethiosulfatibacter aminovorans DSM 17477 TaxID=1121476 RepID=A0A1M6AH22_9FIRM|nr:aspartate carbamoyltransferase regulatory subunit [Dethiosulfatibacter aminovorans]SHI35722.1 aspartate carbamoyltransferase regulatory subunit [Dethiosulfatibacter aminovorans DSM 17477]